MVQQTAWPTGLGQGPGLGFLTAAVAAPSTITTGTQGSLWATGAAAGPIGLAVTGATLAISAWLRRQGPAQKVQTTQIVNEIEPYMKQNLDAYMQGPRTRSSQQQALMNFDELWDYVKVACLRPEFGDPGRRCVSDRQAGGQWDWFAYYRNPIANDPEVRDDPTVAGTTGAWMEPGATVGGISAPLVLAGGLLVLALMLPSGPAKKGRG